MKLYTPKQLEKKYKDKFINVYPHHHEHYDEKLHRYTTVYEVRGVSETIKENFQTVSEIINK